MKSAPRNKIRVMNFSPGSFPSIDLPKILGYKASSWQPSKQVIYLSKYLDSIGTKTIVIEHHYIDRHFMDEHQRYYSSCFSNFGNSSIRLHFFKKSFEVGKFNLVLRSLRTKSEKFFTKPDNYLGCVAFRPIPQALIGRSLLPPMNAPHIESPAAARNITTTIKQKIHLSGMELCVDGLPFQQQDRRVGACASTAVWSALSRVAKSEGMRAPSPAEVTESAVKSIIPLGRPYPQGGLTIEQMCESIRSLGFAPDLTSYLDTSSENFKITFGIYVKSGFPIILCIHDGKNGHVVTSCGHLLNSALSDDYDKYHSPCVQWEQIYFHDDRIGPYAKGFLKQGTSGIQLDIPWHFLRPGSLEHWSVKYMIVPLYAKLRASARELITFGSIWIDLLKDFYGVSPSDLSLDFCFKRSGDVLKDIRVLDIIHNDKVSFMKSVALSRYVGIVDMSFKGIHFIRFLLDTTDRIYWNSMDFSPILGVIIHKQFPITGIERDLKDSGVLVACH